MGIPITLTAQMDAADANGVAEAQTLAGAGFAALDGALVTDDVAILCDDGMERAVIVTSAGDDTGITFTINGLNATGKPISSTFAGASAGAATAPIPYKTVTSVYASGATAGDIEVGTTGVGYSRPAALNIHAQPANMSYYGSVSGTVNYTLQHTLSDLNASGGIGAAVWFDDANMASKAAAFGAVYNDPVYFSRLKINSGDGTATLQIIQAGLAGQ